MAQKTTTDQGKKTRKRRNSPKDDLAEQGLPEGLIAPKDVQKDVLVVRADECAAPVTETSSETTLNAVATSKLDQPAAPAIQATSEAQITVNNPDLENLVTFLEAKQAQLTEAAQRIKAADDKATLAVPILDLALKQAEDIAKLSDAANQAIKKSVKSILGTLKDPQTSALVGLLEALLEQKAQSDVVISDLMNTNAKLKAAAGIAIKEDLAVRKALDGRSLGEALTEMKVVAKRTSDLEAILVNQAGDPISLAEYLTSQALTIVALETKLAKVEKTTDKHEESIGILERSFKLLFEFVKNAYELVAKIARKFFSAEEYSEMQETIDADLADLDDYTKSNEAEPEK